MKGSTRTLAFWLVFVAFAIVAAYAHGNPFPVRFSGPYGAGKLVIWIVFAAFLAYTVYCSRREDLFRSIREIAQLHWGRQIGLDLYIGFSLVAALIGLVTGSWLVALAWLPAIYVFGNLATLWFLVLAYDMVVVRLAG